MITERYRPTSHSPANVVKIRDSLDLFYLRGLLRALAITPDRERFKCSDHELMSINISEIFLIDISS